MKMNRLLKPYALITAALSLPVRAGTVIMQSVRLEATYA